MEGNIVIANKKFVFTFDQRIPHLEIYPEYVSPIVKNYMDTILLIISLFVTAKYWKHTEYLYINNLVNKL